MKKRVLAVVSAAVVTSSLLTACSDDDGPFITVYNAQHEELLEEIAPGFTEETGIDVKLRNGERLRAGQPAGPGGRRLPGRRLPHRELPRHVAGRQRRACSRRSTRRPSTRSPTQYVPSDGNWIGFAARSTVAGLQHRRVERGRPARLDHGPRRPRVGGPGRLLPHRRRLPGDRQRRPRSSRARSATEEWLEGLADNGTVYDGNNVVLESVNAGEVDSRDHLPLLLVPRPGGVRREQRQLGSCTSSATRTPARSSASPAPACSPPATSRTTPSEFVKFLASVEGQQALADSYALEYPLNPERVARTPGQAVRRAASRRRSTCPRSTAPKVIELMQDAGLL